MRKPVLALAALLSIVAFPIAAQQRMQVRPVFRELPATLGEAAITAHVIAPSHVKDIRIEEVDPAREVIFKMEPRRRLLNTSPKVDLGAMGLALHNALKDNVTGYIFQVRHNGQLAHNGIWNWARTPADQQTAGWNENTRMHVASVSKFLTAVALMKALDSKEILYDTAISGYLPAHWSQGMNVNKITFRQLLTHTSGFSTDSSSSDYTFMRVRVAAGVTSPGSYDYENMNFGLCRILIPIINGNISRTATFTDQEDLNHKAWDVVTLHYYRNYVQANVLSPAGVQNAGFAPAAGGALAYPFPALANKGWNSGDLASVAGGAGWRLSTRELLNVMDHVRRRNTVLPATKTQYLLDNAFGIDQVINTPAGKLYNKNGGWGGGAGTEQCVAYFLPNGMELVVFVNSPIGREGFSLRGMVTDAFLGALSN